MTEQLFYAEDTVCLKDSVHQIGVVDRTHASVETHSADPQAEYPNGIERANSISREEYATFIRTGVPPKNTALVTWSFLPWSHDPASVLISESDLTLVDRALLVGDVVKRNARDAMSGTVVEATTIVHLLQSMGWTSSAYQHDHEDVYRSNYPLQPEGLLYGIPADELMFPNHYQEDDFVLFKGWVGRVTDIEEEPLIRLSNNSVVVPEDPEDIDEWSPDPCLYVGDWVSTKKANLRRGRWIYGAYNANIEPAGLVADVRQVGLSVEWLASREPLADPHPQPSIAPPDDLDLDDLQSGELRVYDRRNRPQGNSYQRKINFELTAGDTVRFRDIAGAAVKYDGTRIMPNGNTHGELCRIPRTETLGYDINTFLVVSNRTVLVVEWQDGTTTHSVDACDLIPYLDLDMEDEFWPGDMVLPKDYGPMAQNSFHTLTRVGIIQRVKAHDCVCSVRWMRDAQLVIATSDQPLEAPFTLISGSKTGPLEEEEEEVSVYDLRAIEFGLERRMGDFVAIVPSAESRLLSVNADRYKDVHSVLAGTDANAWFGEVVKLTLDGYLIVRLAAASPPRDVQVPWECTHLIWSSDQESTPSEGDDSEDDDAYSDMSIDSGTIATDMTTAENLLSHLIPGLTTRADAGYVDNEADDVSMGSWETEEGEFSGDEDSNTSDDHNEDNEEDIATDDKLNVQAAETSFNRSHVDGTTDARELSSPRAIDDSQSFSYSTMFTTGSTAIQSFQVLDGAPPADHQWGNSGNTLNGRNLRRVQREHRILSSSLPEGAYVRTWEGSLDCMRILILGPLDTPYELAPFLFDLYLDATFPESPPQLYFHSWTNSQGPCNPNLYEDGKVCLSLLGTWPGDDHNDTWSAKSTILQIIVSLIGLVLVKEPYYNEAGYEVRIGTAESQVPARLYSERAYLRTRAFIAHALRYPIAGFEADVAATYLGGPCLLSKAVASAVEVVRASRQKDGGDGAGGRMVSAGALIPLVRIIEDLLSVLQEMGTDGAVEVVSHRAALQVARGL